MQIKLSFTSTIPLYEQLHNQLRQFILSGHWPPKSRIPSETELQHQLKISRSTIRQAFRNAEIEGLIERIPGRGTFVASRQSRSSTNRLIAFVVFDFDRPIQRSLLSGAEDAARTAGYRVIFSSSNSDTAEENRLLEQLQNDGIAGILLWPSAGNGNPQRLAERSRQTFPPVTMMDRTFDGVGWDYVSSDNYAGAFAVMQHLLELGHQRIAFLSWDLLDLRPIAERFRAYQTALRTSGQQPLQPWLVGNKRELSSTDSLKAYGDLLHPITQRIVHYLTTSAERPTAIFAVNDNLALLVFKAASIAGLQVPDDVSIVGFDDIDLASYLETPLTTVAQDAFAIGKRAAEFLIERMEGWYRGVPRTELIATQLRVRASTSVAPL